ncbi:MAG: 50S ribosomal protein L11 methyltransferase [Candidatus Solibacter usitatus]|nr:50S ribosomal protein L11 methyltransferase [Candidatus Solibacter usitatus]
MQLISGGSYPIPRLITLTIRCNIDDKDAIIAELYGLGTAGITEHEEPGGDCVCEAFFESEAQAVNAQTALSSHASTLYAAEERNYVHDFQKHWQPMPVGRRLWLSPPWIATPPPEGRIRIEYQTGMACGSGAHPCSQLCLEALEESCFPGSHVADVGVGSGILLLAAKALGAAVTVGCDIDADSVGAASSLLPDAAIFTGSASSLASGAFDVVIANISSEAAESLCLDLFRAAKPGGTLIVSGFRGGEIPQGYPSAHQTEREGWACLTLSHPRSSGRS